MQSADVGTRELGAIRLLAAGSQVQVQGFVFTGVGSGDFGTDLAGEISIQVWADNGDEQFAPSTDALLGQSPGNSTAMSVALNVPLSVDPGSPRDLWVAIVYPRIAETDEYSRTYAVSLEQPGDVITSGASVTIGTPMPATAPLTVEGRFLPARENQIPCVVGQSRNGLAVPLYVLALFLALRIGFSCARRYGM
jgi:hypothetical protein